MRKKAAGQSGYQPEVMTVDDIRTEDVHGIFQGLCEDPFIDLQFGRCQVPETGAGIGHDIGHAGNGKGDVPPVERHETAPVRPDAVKFGLAVGLNAGDDVVVVAAGGGFAHHGLEIDTAAGGIRPLAEEVEDLERSMGMHAILPGHAAGWRFLAVSNTDWNAPQEPNKKWFGRFTEI